MARTPVIFVPGLTGSFNLPILLDWRGPSLSGWSFPPFVGYGDYFLKAMSEAGYRRDQDLFVAFYDWRKAVKDNVNDYLIPWIDRAKQRSGASKVNLVCHSMGGLVARSYLQSEHYRTRNDVEQLITLGTPHRGSAEAYYSWGGGMPQADPLIRSVFAVYLWYLRHAHPFQTELDPLRTMRSQVPGVRDLLPIDNFLFDQGGPPLARPEATLRERNLWGVTLNATGQFDLLAASAHVTAIAGTGYHTIAGITVGPAPMPPTNPPRYPDGEPIEERTSPDGDGTVLVTSAQPRHPRFTTPPAVRISHGKLPDAPEALALVLKALGVAVPALPPAPPAVRRLVLLTASPLRLDVTTPAVAATGDGLLGGSGQPARRAKKIHARNLGHRGKRLNMLVIDDPALGAYRLHLEGTATGHFAVGALMIDTDEPASVEVPYDAVTTLEGRVAESTELFYQMRYERFDTAPTLSFDAASTASSAMARLQTAMANAQGGILGGAASDDAFALLLGAAPAETQGVLGAALRDGDASAAAHVTALLSDPQRAPQLAVALTEMTEQAIASHDPLLAAALAEQFAALADQQW